MKIRMGFVSNSSSSSFLVVGMRIDGGSEIAKKSGYDEDEGAHFSYGCWEEANVPPGFYLLGYDSEVAMIGMDIASDIKKDVVYSVLKQKFIDSIKEYYGVEVDPKKVHLSYEEWGSG